MQLLKTIKFKLPSRDSAFGDKLLSLLGPFGQRKSDQLTFTRSDATFTPTVSFHLADLSIPCVEFNLIDQTLKLEVANQTDQQRTNPAAYRHISIDEFIERLNGIQFAALDHVGFNLPWFNGIHPEILELRDKVAAHSAYYRFPTGENWDFILPATAEEIVSSNIDLSKERRPKLEIVSFEKSSIPLIQVDLSVRQSFEKLANLFPEGIVDKNLKNIWVYLTNPYGIDICFVIGEYREGDWSSFFSGHRLRA